LRERRVKEKSKRRESGEKKIERVTRKRRGAGGR
jgi:hypothetical protein